ncbi:MAG: cyanophycin synthetase [Planctomycetota bacterium]
MDPAAAHLAPLLQQLVDYERTRPDRRLWDLAMTRRLLQRPGIAAPPRPAVQVGGSKGKGTTCAFLAALCRAAGRRCGVYSSPHLVTLRERIRVGGEMIPLADLERLLRRILAGHAADRQPTFFEAMTVAAAEWFAERAVDLAVYEVGLGGRFDATTALPVDASILTTIELEHTDVLGDTIAQIAAEKAAILRPGGIGFTGATGEALLVFRAHAAAVGARLCVLGEDFAADRPRFTARGAEFALRLPDGSSRGVVLPDATLFEIPALALAAAAFAHVLPGAELALAPAPRPGLAARFEVFAEPDGEALVIDGAHTEQSLRAVAAELQRRWPGRRASLLFASARGKRWREALSGILARVDSMVVTGLQGTASEDPAVVAEWARAHGIAAETCTDVGDGLAALRRRPGPRVVLGSFYLAGRARELVAATAPTDDHQR